MKTIKFSHNYPKLHRQTMAELLAIKVICATDVQSTGFLIDLWDYDTTYISRDYIRYNYELPKKGQLIQLIFLGNKYIPFCTLRSWNPEKHEYYRAAIGETFKIEVIE